MKKKTIVFGGIACIGLVGLWVVIGVALQRAEAPLPAASSGYSPPRTPDGRPDFSGIWQVLNTAAWNIQDHSASLGVPAGQGIVDGGEIPYQPWAAEKKKENFAKRHLLDPNLKCALPGVPRVTYMPFPFQIIQTPQHIAIAYEYNHAYRTIFVDGSKHPEDVDAWMGDSRGHWEGDTLVVDTTNFNGETWLDSAGNFHSEQLRVTERWSRTGPDSVAYEATLDDPKVFTRPWTVRMPLYRRVEPGVQLLEYECYGNAEDAYLLEEARKGR